MSSIRTEDAAKALAIAIRMKVPVLLWSPPGEGKSSVLQSLARDYGFHMEALLGSTFEPSDFLGVPFISGKEMVYSTPPWAKRILRERETNKKISILFFDEISNASPAVQAAALRVILELVVGDNVQLPHDTRVVAAANPTTINASGGMMKAPTRNRFLHLDWGLSPEYFNEGMSLGFPSIKAPAFPKKAILEQKLRQSKSIVGAFALGNPNLLSSKEEDIVDADSSEGFSAPDMAFPSPRMWENVAKVYTGAVYARFDGEPVSPMVTHTLVAGCVGQAAATAFLSFVNNLDIPDPRPILAGTGKWSSSGKRSDVVYAAIGAMSSMMETKVAQGDHEAWTNFGNELVLIASEGNSDIAFPFAKKWLECRPEGCMPSQEQMRAFSSILS